MKRGPRAALSVRRFTGGVAASESGARLDVWLSARLPDLSRTRIKALVESGLVLVDGRRVKAAHRLRPAERVEARVPPLPAEELHLPLKLSSGAVADGFHFVTHAGGDAFAQGIFQLG